MKKFSEDKKFVIWTHDGIHGTKGLVMLDGEFDAIIEAEISDGVHVSFGKKRKKRIFKPVNGCLVIK
jgi:hypothetical protein